jgi:hypothetical protein
MQMAKAISGSTPAFACFHLTSKPNNKYMSPIGSKKEACLILQYRFDEFDHYSWPIIGNQYLDLSN